MTATPGAAEVRAPVVHVEHIISHSTAANVGVAEKTAATSWLQALKTSKSASTEARRALSVVGSDRKASWDGTKPQNIADRITDPNIKAKTEVQIKGAQVTMAAIDVLRLPVGDQQSRLTVLQSEGKLPNPPANVADLQKLATVHIVSNSFFAEYFKNLPAATQRDQLALETFLTGPMSDVVQIALSEQIGLIDQATLALPLVPESKKAELQARVTKAGTLRDLAKDGMKAEVIKLTGSTSPPADLEQKLIAAAMNSDEQARRLALTQVIAEVDGMNTTQIADVVNNKQVEKDLADKRLARARETDPTKEPIMDAAITSLESQITTFKGLKQVDIDKYDKAFLNAGGTLKVLAVTYEQQNKSAVVDNLELQATPAKGPLTEEARNRAIAEQNLSRQIDLATAKALDEAIEDRIKQLSEGGLKDEEQKAEAARKSGDEVLAKSITAYKDSLRHGDKAYFVTETTVDSKGKTKQTEVMKIDKLSKAMRVIADNDTADGFDGTNFMVAYHAGLFDKMPAFVPSTAVPTEPPAQVAVRAKHMKLALTAAEVLNGVTGAAAALGALDADGQKALKQFCTPERVQGFTKHLFAEYSRAERYVKGEGIFGIGNKLKGIEVKFEGDKKSLDLMANNWDKIFGMHDDQIVDAIKNDKKSLAFVQKLRGENWVTADRKTKGILYALMMLLGLLVVPAGIAIAPGAAGLAGAGGLASGAEAIAGAAAGGFGAAKIIENNS